MIAKATDNIWRHWWAGHMRAVGGTSHLQLDPIDPLMLAPPKAVRRSLAPIRRRIIREHLRGQRLFTWNGLNCELMVSETDMEKNEFFKNQTAGWRAMRKHNRVRVRLKAPVTHDAP
jgi:hypothetical protein